jgi:hypothetical protein
MAQVVFEMTLILLWLELGSYQGQKRRRGFDVEIDYQGVQVERGRW